MATAMSNMEIFRRVWDAFAIGRHEALADLLAPDIELRVDGAEPTYGLEAFGDWMNASRREHKSVTLVFEAAREVADDCIIAFVRFSAYDHGGDQAHDLELAWVNEYRDGRVVRISSFSDRDEAIAYLTARRERL